MGLGLLQALTEALVILGAVDVFVDPRSERFAIPRDHVPGFVKRVVALIVTLRVGGKRSIFEFAGALRSSTISSTVTMARLAAMTASFCTPSTPQISTLPFRSAFCA